MSEAQSENPNQAVQPGAPDPGMQPTPAAPTTPAAAPDTGGAGTEYPIRLVKVEDETQHWNVAKGIWEQVVHAETGEPNSDYALVATIGGVDVELSRWNAGRIDTRVRALQQANQPQST